MRKGRFDLVLPDSGKWVVERLAGTDGSLSQVVLLRLIEPRTSHHRGLRHVLQAQETDPEMERRCQEAAPPWPGRAGGRQIDLAWQGAVVGNGKVSLTADMRCLFSFHAKTDSGPYWFLHLGGLRR